MNTSDPAVREMLDEVKESGLEKHLEEVQAKAVFQSRYGLTGDYGENWQNPKKDEIMHAAIIQASRRYFIRGPRFRKECG